MFLSDRSRAPVGRRECSESLFWHNSRYMKHEMAYLSRFDAIRDFLKSFLAINGFSGEIFKRPTDASTGVFKGSNRC